MLKIPGFTWKLESQTIWLHLLSSLSSSNGLLLHFSEQLGRTRMPNCKEFLWKMGVILTGMKLASRVC
jgi:hypothetical protein